jgi:hypothetical protein
MRWRVRLALGAVVGTNGLRITETLARRLAESGARGPSLAHAAPKMFGRAA